MSLSSCNAKLTMKISNNETLIKNDSKIMGHGYFTFLVFVSENEVNETIYYYSINIKNKKCSCLKTTERRYNVNEYLKKYDTSRFKTAKEFERSQTHTWREKYYNCFVNNFLEMTNDEKIDLLDSISNKSMENCKIIKVIKVTAESNNSYYMQVKFNHCTSNEHRETLIKNEIRNRFPLIGDRTIRLEEYLGKLHGEYKYEIKVE
jgi:hypothetical protein